MFKRNFLKLLIVFVLSIVVVEQTYIPMAQAGMGSYVSNALSGSVSSVTTGQGGFYHAQGEDIYTLGYTRIRFNLTPGNTSLFTIEPPQFSMGCSGIDSMWGGFSMISGAELEQILQNIISIAIPFAFNIALGVLCKQCEAIMNQIEAIANKLNGLNFNSCKTAQVAAGALTGFMQSEIQTGSSNDWESDMNNLLSPSGNPSSGSAGWAGGISNALTSFENAIPNGSCSQQKVTSTYTQTDADIQNIYNTISDCGQEKISKKFHLGSLLRIIADKSNLGLTQGGGYGAGSGGTDGILGILRGSLLGDVYAYIPATPTKSISDYHILPVGSEIAATTNTGSLVLHNAYGTLLTGGDLNFTIITPTAIADNYTGLSSAGQFFTTDSQYCFPGFENIYITYFQAAYNYMMQGASLSIPLTPTACNTSLPTITFGSPSQVAQFISSTNVPALEVIKLAYANNMPGLVVKASYIAGQSALLDWIKPILNGVNMNIYAGQNFNKTAKNSNSVYMRLLKEYQSRVMTVYNNIDAKYRKNVTGLTQLLAQLDTLNKDWIRQLSSQGLMGNYNFSKHLQ